MRKRATLLVFSVFLAVAAPARPRGLEPVEELGARLFFDDALSNPPGQSCAACHDPEAGWTGPDSERNAGPAIYPGAIPTRAGNRKPPSSAYAGFSPVLHRCGDCPGMGGGGMGGGGMGGGGMGGGGMGGGGMMSPGDFVGGMFWDGRAAGWLLGDPLAEQAMGPFLNPLEQANPSAKHVCLAVRAAPYVDLFVAVWGPRSLDCVKDPEGAYERIARSVAAYERSPEVNPFSSRFDAFWDQARGARPPVPMINMTNWARFRGRGLSDVELTGLAIFNTKGRCSDCHWLQPMHGSAYPLFTDFRYHNLGLPRSPQNPFYGMPRPWNPDGEAWIDPGLGGFLATTAGSAHDLAEHTAENLGKHRTPTLRNVDRRPHPEFVKAYGHNGVFKSLAAIVHFYDLRDVLPVCDGVLDPGETCWPAAEVPETVDRTRLGDLGLTPQERMALLEFLKTLDDRDPAP